MQTAEININENPQNPQGSELPPESPKTEILLKTNPTEQTEKFNFNQLRNFQRRFTEFRDEVSYRNKPINEKRDILRHRILNHIGAKRESFEEYLDKLKILRPDLYLRLLEKSIEEPKTNEQTGQKVFAPIIIQNLLEQSTKDPIPNIEYQPQPAQVIDTVSFPALISAEAEK